MSDDVKPGYRSTEFWLTLVALLVGLFAASGILPETHVAMRIAGLIAAALAQVGYTFSRAAVKTSRKDR